MYPLSLLVISVLLVVLGLWGNTKVKHTSAAPKHSPLSYDLDGDHADRLERLAGVCLVVGAFGSLLALPWLWYWFRGPLRTESDPVKRVEVARDLGATRDKDKLRYLVPALTEDRDDRVRAAVACAIGQIGDPGMVPLLVDRVVHSDSRDVIICSLKSIKALDGRSAVPSLVALLPIRTGPVKMEIMETLGNLHDVRALQPLIELALRVQNGDEWEASCRSVAAFGTDALPWVRSAYKQGFRLQAINIMRYMGDVAGDDLAAAVNAGSRETRTQAIRATLLSRGPKVNSAGRSTLATNLRLVAEAHNELIELGDSSFVPLLARALVLYGNADMAVTYLNTGEPTLASSAREWARLHGFRITSSYLGTRSPRWGRH